MILLAQVEEMIYKLKKDKDRITECTVLYCIIVEFFFSKRVVKKN